MHELKMPQMGQSVEEASIVQWLKQEGDRVEAGDALFTIQTDKAEIECEAPVGGYLRKILIQPDVSVPVLTVIAFIGEKDEPIPETAAATKAEPAAAATAAPVQQTKPTALAISGAAAVGKGPISPRAKAKAKELSIDPARAVGTGAGGRVIESDVVAYAESMSSLRVTPTARRVAENLGIDLRSVTGSGERGKITKADVQSAGAGMAASVALPEGAVERIPHTPMRRIIARRMAESMYSAPHYYMTVSVDMSAAKAFRAGITAYKLSLNDLVLKAVIDTLRAFPAVNARWCEDAIEQMGDVNLGIAVALPSGLIVPVLKRAQALSVEQISAQARALIEKARNGKLMPDDYTGNTFTVSNLGPYGVDHFTAIINQPDSAILAVGQMKEQVVVIDGGIHIRPMMNVTMSSDHRVVDGALAAQYLAKFKEILERAAF
jgi:pyruvate dehydrogenase E2 component (dihydrolipoamide acetyltransferase)